jgi:Cellulose biosynthesis protein BcsQ
MRCDGLRLEVPMRTVFWSAKGGSGVTVTAAALALATPDCLLVDLGGDAALALGFDEPSIGLFAWLHATQEVDASALDRLIVSVRPGLALLPAGTTRPESPANAAVVAERFALLENFLSARSSSGAQTSPGQVKQQQRVLMNAALAENRSGEKKPHGEMQWANVIVDAGTPKQHGSNALEQILRGADRSLLVVKSCFLAVHAAVGATHLAQGIVVVCDEERRIANTDIASALGIPVVATVMLQPGVARAVDAGLLVARLPRSFTRSLDALRPSTATATPRRRTLHRTAAVAS